MANIIDELIIKMSLDTSGFQAAQRAAQSATRKVSDEAQNQAKLMEAAGNKAAAGFNKLRNEALALLALFLGANGMRQFIRDTTNAEVATGNLAKNIGMSVTELDAWGKASERLGGNAQATQQSLLNLGQAVQRLLSFGETSETTNLLSRLGINMVDPKTGQPRDPGDIIRDLSRAVQDMPRPQAYNLLTSMGLDPGTINLVLEGVSKLSSDLEDARRVAMSWKDTNVGQELYKQFVIVSQEVSKFARDLLTDVAPALTVVLKAMSEWIKLNGDWLRGQIEQKVGEFVTWLRSIDWNSIIEGIKGFFTQINTVVEALGGWQRVVEVIIGLKLGSWILGLLGPITSLVGLLATLNPAFATFLAAAGLVAAAGYGAFKTGEKTAKAGDLGFRPSGMPGSIDEFGNVSMWTNPKTGETITADEMDKRLKTSSRGTSPDKEKMAKESYDFWIGKGYTPSAAAGMVAQEEQESGFNPGAVGDSGQAHGSFQWHDDRRRQILAGTGIDVADSKTTHQQMLDAAHWELTHTERKAGDMINQQGISPGEAGARGSRLFERPGNAAAEAQMRGDRSVYWDSRFRGPDTSLIAGAKPATVGATASSATTNNTHSVDTNINGPIQIHTAATDSDGIAKGIGQSLRKYAVVGQINYGLA